MGVRFLIERFSMSPNHYTYGAKKHYSLQPYGHKESSNHNLMHPLQKHQNRLANRAAKRAVKKAVRQRVRLDLLMSAQEHAEGMAAPQVESTPTLTNAVLPQQRYRLYHDTDLLSMLFPDPERWQRQQNDWGEALYRCVAEVVATSLEEVFALTNHGSHWGDVEDVEDMEDWTARPDLVLYHGNEQRSTSVGDVVAECDTGTAWMVMPHGWHRLQEVGA
jgi:hypothetical protein